MILLVLGVISCFAAEQDSVWARRYGTNSAEFSIAIRKTLDGCYIFGGSSLGYGTHCQAVLMKINAVGDSLCGIVMGVDTLDDCIRRIVSVPDGYVFSGYTGVGSNTKMMVGKISTGFDSLWYRNYGGVLDGDGEMVAVAHNNPDSGFVISGFIDQSSRNGLLLRLNANGDSLWSRTFGGSGVEEFKAITNIWDGGYILAGTTTSGTAGYNVQVNLIRVNAAGDSLWGKTIGVNSTGKNEYSSDIIVTSDSCFLIGGISFSSSNFNIYAIKTDSLGDTLWTKTMGGSGIDKCIHVLETREGKYLFIGYSSSYGAGGSDAWIVELDTNGDSLWSRTFGGPLEDLGGDIVEVDSLAYIIVGTTNSFAPNPTCSDFWLIGMGDFPVIPTKPQIIITQ